MSCNKWHGQGSISHKTQLTRVEFIAGVFAVPLPGLVVALTIPFMFTIRPFIPATSIIFIRAAVIVVVWIFGRTYTFVIFVLKYLCLIVVTLVVAKLPHKYNSASLSLSQRRVVVTEVVRRHLKKSMSAFGIDSLGEPGLWGWTDRTQLGHHHSRR